MKNLVLKIYLIYIDIISRLKFEEPSSEDIFDIISRLKFEEPSSEDIFDMIYKESPKTFYVGKLMQARVERFVS